MWRLALVNNMPDAALEDTERQFCGLLRQAAGPRPVSLSLHYLPSVPRGAAARERLRRSYLGWDELFNHPYDGVIVTGTEPQQSDLRQEPYWPELAQVFDWAARETRSAIYSCLAAHAAVLHTDGIARQPRGEKLLGIFPTRTATSHPLLEGVECQFPHSRWNELRAQDLATAGYAVLAQSPEAGVDVFVKEWGRNLAVCLQGHPEYQATTLLKEYRRDVRRFLLGQRAVYPALPRHYFGPSSAQALAAFQQRAQARPHPKLMTEFPDASITARLRSSWAADARVLYRNWLGYLAAHPRTRAAVVTPGRAADVCDRAVPCR